MAEIKYDQYVRINRFALESNEWKELLLAQSNNYSYPLEIILKNPKNDKDSQTELVDFNTFSTIKHFKVYSQAEFQLILNEMDANLIDELNYILIVTCNDEYVGFVDTEYITLYGVLITEIVDIERQSEYHQFFNIVLANLNCPVRVIFCGGALLTPIEKVYKFTINEDDNWEEVFTKSLVPLLEREELTKGFFAFKKGIDKKAPYLTLDNFTIAFHLNQLHNFLLARDANDVFTFIDHEYTNFNIVRFGNLNSIY
ncbi:hypothetical protein [Exiguobacterium sp. NG55]|uniref:hypothetical protein n=1 Tax=Exiguobacterium sp. NG55 TaxID=375477 RepID=UPI0004DF83D0|nr:hypothetical protein [Exiguobacterium sp. NG55]